VSAEPPGAARATIALGRVRSICAGIGAGISVIAVVAVVDVIVEGIKVSAA
jgi:hypothetical protein